jgi:hypothetical protein
MRGRACLRVGIVCRVGMRVCVPLLLLTPCVLCASLRLLWMGVQSAALAGTTAAAAHQIILQIWRVLP